MPIKTFRGMLIDGALQTISLHTNNGETGYRIVKFELMPYDPASQSSENTIAIWKTEVDATFAQKYVDFSQNRLIAAGYIENGASNEKAMVSTIIFDREIVNQDLYITNVVGDVASSGINYYIELEQVKLARDESTVATLKDIRNRGPSS